MSVSNIYPSWYYYFPLVNQITRGNTRQGNKLNVPRHKTDVGGRSTKILGPREWNAIPSDATYTNSLHTLSLVLLIHF